MTEMSADVNVLLVEDDEVDQMAFRRAFKQLDIENPLVIAKDGVEAMERLDELDKGELKRPFIVILDLNMPRMDGIEFMEKIRANEKYKNLVVFVLTTSSDAQDLKMAYKLNAAGYVVKTSLAGSFANAVDMISHYWRTVELPA